MFDRCEFTDNKAGEDGGAIVALDDGLVLSNVTITDNSAGGYGGGVFVDARYDINVKGIVIIKDNKCDKDSTCNDLALEDGTAATARVYSGGLIDGSWIAIGSTASGSIRMSKKMSVYEMKYFHDCVRSFGRGEEDRDGRCVYGCYIVYIRSGPGRNNIPYGQCLHDDRSLHGRIQAQVYYRRWRRDSL